MSPDAFDADTDTNVTASLLLDEHHVVVGEPNGEGYVDNCDVCGFAVGWVPTTVLAPEHWGHATQVSSADVRA